MSDQALDFSTYVRRAPLNQEGLTALVQGFWRHGLAFTPMLPMTAAWEDALKEPIKHFSHDPQTIHEAIAEILAKQSGGLTLWDRWFPIMLGVDPNYYAENTSRRLGLPLDSAHPQYGSISIGTPSSRTLVGQYGMHYDTLAAWNEGPLLQIHQQVMTALCHWAQVLCSLVAPDFGFLCNLAAVEDTLPLARDTTIPSLLAQGILPNVEELLQRRPYAFYADAHLVRPEHIVAWLAQDNTNVQRVGTGYFVTSQPGLYRYGNNVGIAYMDQAVQARKMQQPQQSGQLFQSATGIFTTLADEVGLETTNILRSHLYDDELLAEKKVPEDEEDDA